MELHKIIAYLDRLLEIEKIEDASLNGLQVENNGIIEGIYSGVDICGELVKKATEKSLIVVHHGLFWGKPVAITKNVYKIIRGLIEKDCALYTAHLPLDSHKEFGNNHGFYKLAGWEKYIKESFSEYKKTYLSGLVEFPEERDITDVLENIRKIMGKDMLLWDFGRKKIKRAAFVSGGGAGDLPQALKEKLDLFITGETSHNLYWYAKDNAINVLFAGHYNTEKICVKLLGKHLSEKFDLKHEFIYLPTGL